MRRVSSHLLETLANTRQRLDSAGNSNPQQPAREIRVPRDNMEGHAGPPPPSEASPFSNPPPPQSASSAPSAS